MVLGDDKSSSENADGMEDHTVGKDEIPSSSTNSTNEFEIKETKGIKFKADLENYSQEFFSIVIFLLNHS